MSFVLCPECGFCLGEIYMAYQIISLARRLPAGRGKIPDNMILMPDQFDDEKDILDMLRINNTCCRAHVMTVRSKEDVLAAYTPKRAI